MTAAFVITKEKRATLEHVAQQRFAGGEFTVRAWDELGGFRAALGRVRAARPAELCLHVADLALFHRPLAHKLFMLLAAPRAKRVLFDDFGGEESASLGHILLVDAPRFILGALAAPFVALKTRFDIWRLDQPTPVRRAPHAPTSVAVFRPHFFHIQFGGTLAHLHGVLDGLAANDCAVTLIATDRPMGVPAHVKRLHVPPPVLFRDFPETQELAANANIFAAARHAFAQGAPDVIYQRHQGSSLFGLRLARAFDRPLILEFNSSDTARERLWGERKSALSGLKAALERVVLRRADLVVAVSSVLKRQAIEFAGVEPDRVLVQSNGVNPERFRPDRAEPALRAELGLAESDVAVGFLGTLGAYMGLDVLLDAADLILAEPDAPKLRFVIIGEGGLRPDLEKRAARSPALVAALHFTGAVNFADAPRYLACCDIAVSPHNPPIADKDFYWSPIKIFEYMAAGKPIIASDVGQMREILADGETALLVPRGDAAALARAIKRLAADPALRARLGAAARHAAVSQHAWQAATANILAAVDAPHAPALEIADRPAAVDANI